MKYYEISTVTYMAWRKSQWKSRLGSILTCVDAARNVSEILIDFVRKTHLKVRKSVYGALLTIQ